MDEMKLYATYLIVWCAYWNVSTEGSLVPQKEKHEKTDRFGTSWWGSEPWMSDHQVPTLIGPPLHKPGFERSRGKMERIRPPSEHIRPASPSTQSTSSTPSIRQEKIEFEHTTRMHADDIKCTRSNGLTIFSARIIPPRDFSSSPVFENADHSYSPSECHMKRSFHHSSKTFDMHVQHFSKCGVRIQQDADGKEWISVTLRFPFVEGLRMSEDEYVVIMCRPQERIALSHHVIHMRGRSSESSDLQRKKVFRSNSRGLSCNISLATIQSAFSREIRSGDVVNVGQDLQITANVKEGDGWKYAMLKEVTVSCPSEDTTSSGYLNDFGGENAVYSDKRSAPSGPDSAHLVHNNGCRNPIYKAIARQHPQRESKNPLVVSFTFKAFMFQNMADGETLRISIKVVACAELADCLPRFCDGDSPKHSEGRQRRESIRQKINQSEDFTELLDINVALGGLSMMPLTSSSAEMYVTENSMRSCKMLWVTVLSVFVLFCTSVTGAIVVAIENKRRKSSTEQNGDRKHKMKTLHRTGHWQNPQLQQ